jgi:hypothetical protein
LKPAEADLVLSVTKIVAGGSGDIYKMYLNTPLTGYAKIDYLDKNDSSDLI